MDNKDFDQHLKSVLENLEPPYDPASWTALQARMDAALVEENPVAVDAVDKAVYHTLERLEAPYQQAHWKLLAERLSLQAARVRRLRIAKVFELSLLLLLIWHFPTMIENGATRPFEAPKFRPDVPVAQAGGGATNPHGTARAAGTLTPAQRAMIQAALQPALSSGAAPDLLSPNHLMVSQLPEIFKDYDKIAGMAQPRIAGFDLLPTDNLAAMFVPDRAVFFPIIPVKTPRAVSPFYVSAAANLDQNSVRVGDVRRNSAGYGAAIAVGYRPGKWGVEAGIGYTHRRYTPKRKVEIYSGNLAQGYYGSTLTGVDADIVSVPVKVTRRVARLGRTTLHATAGVTANIAAQKSYDYGTVFYAPASLPPNFLPDPNQSPQFRQAGRGILENGRLRENFYASADVGIRIERPLGNKQYTAFVEPAFRKSLSGNGIGPQREPINTFSVQVGILYKG